MSQPLWIAAGARVIAVHAVLLLLALRLLRAPAFSSRAASQAAVGGYSSAPVVAEIYQPAWLAVGRPLAVVWQRHRHLRRTGRRPVAERCSRAAAAPMKTRTKLILEPCSPQDRFGLRPPPNIPARVGLRRYRYHSPLISG